MKKIFNIIALTATVLFASCNMDKMPDGYVDPGKAFDNIQSIEQLELGAYSRLRSMYTPSSMITPDIQADYVHQVIGHRNKYGEIYKGTHTRTTGEISSVWNSCYYTIALCNYILDNTVIGEEFQDYKEFKDEALARLRLVRGRLHLMRAMSYSLLAERFCADYDDSKARAQYSGLPLMTSHQPDAKPSRSTLYDVYDRIVKDLDIAAEELSAEKGKAHSINLNMDCVTALRARVYLQMDLYPEAYTQAELLMKNTQYALASSQEEFDNVWTYDEGKEIIFKFAASKTEGLITFGEVLMTDRLGGSAYESDGVIYWQSEFLPTQKTLDYLLESENDYRYNSWIHAPEWDGGRIMCLTYSLKIAAPNFSMVSKFPGNPNLRPSSGWNFANAWKPFRLAEAYLIAAEASLMGASGDPKQILNELRAHRGLLPLESVTMDELKAERFKEMIFEGTRLTDLKRWGNPMERQGKGQIAQQLIDGVTGKVEGENVPLAQTPYNALTMQVGDYRFLWPIPDSEMFSNQNLTGQQNPGWN